MILFRGLTECLLTRRDDGITTIHSFDSLAQTTVQEPQTGEVIIPRTANRSDNARTNVRTRGFWGLSCEHTELSPFCHVLGVWRQKREYGDRIRKIEAAPFALLCVCHHRGHGREATTLYKHLPDQLAAQHNAAYSTMAWRRIHMHHIILLHKICSDVHEWQLVLIPPCPKPASS